MPLGRQSGQYQAALNKSLGFEAVKKTAYLLSAPGQGRRDLSRATVEMPLMPAHEVAKRAMVNDPTTVTRLDELLAAEGLPPSYHENPIARASNELVMPRGIGMGGQPTACPTPSWAFG